MIPKAPYRNLRPHFLIALVFAALLAVPSPDAQAGKPEDITESEMKLIPEYCPDTMGFGYGDAYYNTSPRAAHWVALMGKGFWHMHHYCWARINMNRAQRAGVPMQTKIALWGSALGDYKYVINHVPRNFVMLPEVYTKLGEVELLLGQPNKAQEAFAIARKLRPDYWPAYSNWAEFLMNRGKRSEALKVVTAGLEYSPNAKVLLELFKLLGGKPSDIPPPRERPEGGMDTDSGREPPDKTEISPP